MLGTIVEWIQPDVRYPAVWCYLVYATFLYTYTQDVRMKIMLGPLTLYGP